MADIAVSHKEPLVEQTGFRLSWGAIFAGLFVAIGVHLVLALLGIAIGMSAWNPASPGGVDAGDVAAGVGIWAAISALIALFVGGATTGRLAGILNRKDGALHGAVLWSLTTVVLMWLIVSGLGFLLGGAFDIAGRTASAAVQTVGGAAGEFAGPAVTAGVRGEERETLVTEIANRTGLSRAEAESIVGDAETRAQQARQRAGAEIDTLRQRAPQIADDASDAAARGAWWALLALGISLGAATFGATMTARE
jgi:hypothetical protein